MDANLRQKLIVGNWKMHTRTADARRLAEAIAAGLGTGDRVRVAVCPPFPYLPLVGQVLRGTRIALGAQNLFPASDGAFTGEVSPAMLADLGCTYVIVGHSERRHTFAESDAFISQKVRAALRAGLEPILCVGETRAERDANQTQAVLDRQLLLGLAGVSADAVSRVTIAYEPIWAIGAHGHQATPPQVLSVHAAIRGRVEHMFGDIAARKLAIQYGGSIHPDNAAALLRQEGVDGGLVGGASLDAGEFLAVLRAAAGVSSSHDGPIVKHLGDVP
jgi:triosephosphate isomerase